MGKYYSVRVGRKTGIFNSWPECEKQVKGYKGAKYKSFTSYEEAKKFLTLSNDILSNTTPNSETTSVSKNDLCIYVDGSYSKIKVAGGYGCVMVKNNEIIHTISNSVNIDENENLWNVAGEIEGALSAIDWALSNNYKKVILYYDYEGIENWAKGIWEAKKSLSKRYVQKIKDYSKSINIHFIKVKAHSGDEYNELADKLAKDGVGKRSNDRSHSDVESNQNLQLTFELYNTIINDTSNEKFIVKVEKYIFNENILKKIAKYYWKIEGRKLKDLTDICATLDIQLKTLRIEYLTIDSKKVNKTLKLEGY